MRGPEMERLTFNTKKKKVTRTKEDQSEKRKSWKREKKTNANYQKERGK